MKNMFKKNYWYLINSCVNSQSNFKDDIVKTSKLYQTPRFMSSREWHSCWMIFLIKILIIWILSICLFIPEISFARVPYIGIGSIWIFQTGINPSLDSSISNIAYKLIRIVKYVFSWILLIIIVYAWALMIISMWSSEESLSKWKRILWYSLIWLLFINMPWVIYEGVTWTRGSTAWWLANWWYTWFNSQPSDSLFANISIFAWVVSYTVIKFLKILIVGVAIIVIMISWIKIMTSRWREDQVKEARNKILWSVIWLIFVWFIEAWQTFVYTWIIDSWTEIFTSIVNIALLLAIPVALFFLTLAWYYFIVAAWDQEKTKKGKSIVINVFLAIVILLISYIFLIDLMSLSVG
jgi:hypothetical protein